MTIKKNVEGSVFLLIWSFVVSHVFTIKQGKMDCEFFLGECVNHTEHLSNVFNKLGRKIVQYLLYRLFFLGHDWPDKCTE